MFVHRINRFHFWVACLFLGGCVPAVQESADTWFPFQPGDGNPPGVIGMADWLDAPAGKHGFVQMAGKDLRFEDGTLLKFWGVNISGERAFSDSATVEQWVQQLSKYGVNGVRFHKFTWHANAGDRSTVLDSAKFARFDHFQARLRERGIYYGWSHIYGHKVRPADRERLLDYDEIANLQYPWRHLNGTTSSLVNFAPDLQQLSIELTVNMLEHRNPLTGLRYADDPALAFIELQNEDNIFWSAIQRSLEQAPTYRRLLCEQFSDWLRAKYRTETALLAAWGADALPAGQSLAQRNIFPDPNHERFSRAYESAYAEGRPMPRHLLDKLRFLYETQRAFYERFVAAIRATGYRGAIVASCWQAGTGPAHFYNLYADYQTGIIDRHNYSGGGTGHRLDTGQVNNTPLVSRPGIGLLSTGMQQVADRPFALSEWMALLPNEWIAEAGPLIAVYGMGLQGWDASFHFGSDFPHFTETIHAPGVYNVTSPTQLGLYPALARMVYRGDVEEGPVIASRNVHIPSLAEGRLGFLERVEQGYDDKFITGDVPAEALAIGRQVVTFTEEFVETSRPDLSAYWDREQKTIRSATGQLKWDYSDQGYFTLNSPASKAVVGFAAGQRHELGDLAIEVHSPFAVVLVTALEPDKELSNSKHLLLTTMARARNTGMAYNADRSRLLAVGRAPILLEPVSLQLTLKRRGAPTVHILDHAGRRTGRTLKMDGNRLEIEGEETKTIYYEIAYD